MRPGGRGAAVAAAAALAVLGPLLRAAGAWVPGRAAPPRLQGEGRGRGPLGGAQRLRLQRLAERPDGRGSAEAAWPELPAREEAPGRGPAPQGPQGRRGLAAEAPGLGRRNPGKGAWPDRLAQRRRGLPDVVVPRGQVKVRRERGKSEADFEITLRKYGRLQTLGVVQTNAPGRGTIVIEGINEGLVKEWNNQANLKGDTSSIVRKGDSIVAVNDVYGNAEMMILETRQSEEMTVVIRRDLTKEKEAVSSLLDFARSIKREAKAQDTQDSVIEDRKPDRITKEVVQEARDSLNQVLEEKEKREWFINKQAKVAAAAAKVARREEDVRREEEEEEEESGSQRRGADVPSQDIAELATKTTRAKGDQAFEKALTLKRGQRFQGVVTGTCPSGIFVDIGVNKDGFVDLDAMQKKQIEPKDAVEVGEEVIVWFDRMDYKKGTIPRIYLSQRPPFDPNPFKKYGQNHWILGNITGIDNEGLDVLIPPHGDDGDWQEGRVRKYDIREAKPGAPRVLVKQEGFRYRQQVLVRVKWVTRREIYLSMIEGVDE